MIILLRIFVWRYDMAVSYKKLLHLMIEKDITNAKLMKEANISANIIKKIKTGKYICRFVKHLLQ